MNLPSEDYDIGSIISQFETMGIDVTVNLNAFDKNLGRNKQIHEMAGLNVVTFSTNLYKPSHIIAKRIIDILWCYCRTNYIWSCKYSPCANDSKRWWTSNLLSNPSW